MLRTEFPYLPISNNNKNMILPIVFLHNVNWCIDDWSKWCWTWIWQSRHLILTISIFSPELCKSGFEDKGHFGFNFTSTSNHSLNNWIQKVSSSIFHNTFNGLPSCARTFFHTSACINLHPKTTYPGTWRQWHEGVRWAVDLGYFVT